MNSTVEEVLRFEDAVQNILNFVVSQYFSLFYLVCVITSKTSDIKPRLSGFNLYSFEYENSSKESRDNFRKAVESGCQSFVISDDAILSFMWDFRDIHDDCIQRFPNKHIIVYPTQAKGKSQNLISSWKTISSIEDLPNILLVEYQELTQTFSFLTTKYAGNNNDSTDLVMLSEIYISDNPRMKLQSVKLFPDKTSNLQGREIVLAIFNYMPYVLWKEVVGVGALYSWYHESLYLSLSKYISRTGITCITPKPGLLSPISTHILPFSTELWIAVIVSYFICALLYKTLIFFRNDNDQSLNIQSDESLSKIFLDMLGIFVLHSVALKFKQFAVMIFIAAVLIVGLLIGNSYSSAMASVLTIPHYEKGIDTVEELADSDTEWGSTHDAWIFSLQLATQPMILKLLDKFRTFSKEILQYRGVRQDISFSIERLPYGHYAVGEYVTEETVKNYQIMLNDIYYELCVAMSTKTWPLMEQLDDLILQIAQSGIQQFVELDVVTRNTNNKIQAEIALSRHRDNVGPINLSPSHVIGPFILLGVGLTFSSIVFISEILIKRNARMKCLK
ncbi:CLUMA_CG007498, isoform A [Clunio marinus]|uniref:CLUMA_CG007498, isoform A n=1 Tax=Clunio marinus TaxID=568069 RepID=A0A1J1I306_9DIPT|nr:CLUMA_CG007498, isoform A [Clunio marinus]